MMKVTNHEPKNLRWWYEQFLSQRIDMDPDYQRKSEIWSPWKRGHLIDSIINQFDVPKFYVANFYLNASVESNKVLNKHQKRYAIIDGKQRFGTIFKFFAGEVRLNPSCVLDDDPDVLLGKMSYGDLLTKYPAVASRFEEFVPTVMNVVADEESKITDLFIRLNMGEATTGAERRNAMGGPVMQITRELSNHPFFLQKIKFAVKRMQEHNLITKLLMFEFNGELGDTKAKNLDDFTKRAAKWAEERDKEAQSENEPLDMGPYGEARDRVYEVLERLTLEFQTRDPLLSKQGEIPIYYWFAREHTDRVNELRDFVLEFSEKLLTNLREQRDNPALDGDNELTNYYTMSRTTNDQASLVGRYRIFVRRFNRFRPMAKRR